MLNSTDFVTEISSPNPTVVKFFTTSCGPCKLLVPVMERVIEANPNINFYQVDAYANHDLTEKYNITSVPTVIFFKNGEEVGRVNGLQIQATYQKMIDEKLDIS